MNIGKNGILSQRVKGPNGTRNISPRVDAGVNQTITLPTNSVTLTGTASDPDGSIAGYLWTKTSGPTCTIVSPASATTNITGLTAGTYIFNLKVVDNRGKSASDSITVIVNPVPNTNPIAGTGANQTITLPTNSVTVNGSSSTDPDGSIVSYLWTKISGPASSTITSPTSAITTITGLTAGTYVFQLTVTDNLGATGSKSTTIIVNSALPVNQPPIANAGGNKTITLPTATVTLTGSATDADGTVVSYAWTKLSGPSGGTIVSPSSATTVINSLVEGTYVFQLLVTDNLGSTDTDTATVIVNPSNILPIVNAGTDLIITVPTSTVSLTGSATDADGTIVSYLWTKVSGTGGVITTPTSASTTITGLGQGVYVFQLSATDNSGGVGTDTIQITVQPITPPPPTALIALASAPTTPVNGTIITLPTSSVSLVDASTAPGYSIVQWNWTKISGTGGTITSPTSSATTITGLTQGNYIFQLQVWMSAPWSFSNTTTFSITVNAAVPTGSSYYVSPSGSDTNTGTISSPWKTLTKASTVLAAKANKGAGDIVYVRGGTYNGWPNTPANGYAQMLINNLAGTASSPVTITNYPGETPIFDFSAVVPNSTRPSPTALSVFNSVYLNIKGLRFTGYRQIADGSGVSRGLELYNCQNMTIENCTVDYFQGTGFFISSASTANITYLNCDSHHNEDPLSADGSGVPGSDAWDNADGFGVTGSGNNANNITFIGCRAWLNCDDGWDNIFTNGVRTWKNCWAFLNGYYQRPGMPTPLPAGNGNGFKLGSTYTDQLNISTQRVLYNCLAFNNRAHGFDQNGTPTTGMTLYNCTAYNNSGYGFQFQYYPDLPATVAHLIKNCISYNNTLGYGNLASAIPSGVTNDTWNLPVTVSDADFLSVSSIGADGARQADGSLPNLNFMKLAATSDLINKGVNVGLPFNGSAPDLGAYES